MQFLPDDVEGLIQRFSPFTEPGSSILIAKGEKILFNRGYGFADLESGLPAAADTSYLIASVSKQFTCAAAMLLNEAGKLDIDAPIKRYISHFPAFGNQVTIRHLMTHTSGIPDYFTPQFMAAHCEETSPDMDLSALLELIADKHRHLEFGPGSDWAYSNSGYVILGEIIERAADMSFEDYLQQKIFTPLGMNDTEVGVSFRRPPKMAKGYRKNASGQFVPCPYTRAVVGWADGNVISNCPDLFTWLRAIHKKALLSDDSWRQILTPHTLNSGAKSCYGLGWFFSDLLGVKERWHTGSTIGYHCRVSWFEKQQTAVIWLLNEDAAGAEDLNIPFGHLIRYVLGEEMDPMPRMQHLPGDDADRWLGTWGHYSEEEGEEMTFTITQHNDGRLSLSGKLKGTTGNWPLVPRADEVCWIDSGARYFLVRESRSWGNPPVLQLHLHGRTLAFQRVN